MLVQVCQHSEYLSIVIKNAGITYSRKGCVMTTHYPFVGTASVHRRYRELSVNAYLWLLLKKKILIMNNSNDK